MSARQRVVAELGRPETADETAARKAESRRKHFANQTLVNLVLALLATLALVVFMVVIVVRHELPAPEPIDVATPAAEAEPVLGVPALAPTVPEGWAANAAEVRGGPGDVPQWYVGWVIDDARFASMTQGVGADPTWRATMTRDAVADGSETIDGVEWQVADQRDQDDAGNLAWVAWTTTETSTIIVAGTATDAEMHTLLEAVTDDLAP